MPVDDGQTGTVPGDEKTRVLLHRIKQDWESADLERGSRMSDWQKWRDQYDSKFSDLTKLKDDEVEEQSLFIPKTYAHVHRTEAALLAHFFPMGRPKLCKITPTTLQGMLPLAAKLLDDVLHAKVDIELNPVRAFADAFNATLVEGVGVLKMGWEQRDNHNGPVLHFIPNEHALWDPLALEPETISYFIHEFWVTPDELRRRGASGYYKHVDMVLEHAGHDAMADTWRSSKGAPANRERDLIKLIEFTGPQQMLPDEELTGKHRFGEHMLAQDVVVTVYDHRVLLRMEPNPWADLYRNPKPMEKLPYALATALPRRGHTYAYAMTEILRAIQRAVNLTHNNRLMVTDMEMGSKVVIDETRLLDVKSVKDARYGGIIRVQGDPNTALKWFVPQTSTAHMMEAERVLDDLMRQVTGVTEVKQGMSPGMAGGTATGMSLLAEEGAVVQDIIIENVKHSAVIPVSRFFAAAALRYVEPAEMSAILGYEEPLPDIRPILQDEYHVDVEAGASATSKTAEQRGLMNALQALGQVVNADPDTISPAMIMIVARLLKLSGVSDVAGYLAKATQGRMGGQGPAAQQVGGMPNTANQTAMDQQGRSPLPEETPAPVGV
jgi:hypothetical protein